MNVSNRTSSPQEEPLCQIILKHMHKCTSYNPDKLNSWPFYHLTFKCDLDHQPTSTNVSNGTCTFIHRFQNDLAQLFSLKVEVKARTKPDGWTYACTHAHTSNWSCNKYVSLSASGLDKMFCPSFMVLKTETKGKTQFRLKWVGSLWAISVGPMLFGNRVSCTSGHFIWNLWNETSASFINFIWNVHKC